MANRCTNCVVHHMSPEYVCLAWLQDTQDRPSKRHKATIGCGDDDPGVVVSVMLPTKSEGSPENEFTALDQLYVVVLTPGVKYSTYSCLLPKPVLV